MPSSDGARKLIFVSAVAALIAWVLVLGLADNGSRAGRGAPKDRQRSAAHTEFGGTAGDRERPAVAQAALEFTDAYLAYEVGELSHPERRSLIRLATSRFADQLLAEHPRQPATGAPVREWASRVEAVHVAIFEGTPALLTGVVVVGVNGAHVLTLTFLERGSRWLVTGIGE
ncbi:MAG TPA: hypothetical protein VGK66_02460 [Solirubrobacterales bacterium]|nr:hypothetical protein [Solirubrobacterales bacterium]